MGYEMLGLDVSERMVQAAEENLRWLYPRVLAQRVPFVAQHDVRQPFGQSLNNYVDAIVTEPYLGKPLTSPLARAEAEKRLTDLADLYLSLFKQAVQVFKDDEIGRAHV